MQNFIYLQCPFHFKSQQDVAENLQLVFDELKGTSIRTDDLISNTLRTTITCNIWFCSAVKEEKLDTVSVPMAENSSLEKFLSSDLLALDKECFCLSCNSCKETINDTSVIQSAPVLVIHLKHSCDGSQVPSWRPSSNQKHWQQRSFFFEQLLFGGHN